MSSDTPRVWAIVTKARATYYKPLWEGFAQAQPDDWRTLIVWPAQHDSEHPVALTTPEHPRIELAPVSTRSFRKPGDQGAATHYRHNSITLPTAGCLRALRRQGLEGVIIHELSPFTLLALLHARWHKLPVLLMTDVGADNAAMYPWHVRLWHGFWGRFVDGVVAGCPAACRLVCGASVPVFKAFHAVDAEAFKPLPKSGHPGGPVVFVFSGQMIHRKGMDLLFKASRRLRDEVGDVFRIRVLGPGDEQQARTIADAEGVADLVDWRGFLVAGEMIQALATADVFVLPTRADSYAVVVQEAACLGLPLIISQHAGAAEAVVKDRVNGFIIDPADAETFCDRMRRLLDAPTRLRMSAAARLRGEELSSPKRGAALWESIAMHFVHSPSPSGS